MEEAEPVTAKRLVAKLGDKQRMTYRITPMPGALLPAGSLGGQLSALADLFRALGRQDGLNLKTLVSDISMDDDGSINFELYIIPAVENPFADQPPKPE